MSQITNQEPNTPTKTIIAVSPSMQDKIVDQILVNSGGIGLGIFMSFFALIFTFKYLGAGAFFNKFMETMDKSTDSLKSLTNSIDHVSDELDINHQKYVNDHQVIMEKIEQVKQILKEDVIDAIESIEKKLNK